MKSMSASTASLPSYHYEPQDTEQRLLLRERYRDQRPLGNFVKNSRGGDLALRLTGQRDDASLPEYGRGAFVDGTVELSRTDNIHSIDVKIEGTLKLEEVAEGGKYTTSLCLDVKTLWNRNTSTGPCPSSLPFSLILPFTFHDEKGEYPLPPTYEVNMSGVPGFFASISYNVSAVITKNKPVNIFGSANTTVSTPFVYMPRSRPAVPLPQSFPRISVHPTALELPDWAVFNSTMLAKTRRNTDITSHLYLPASRVFCAAEPIPFNLFFSGSSLSLAAFLPYAPTAGSGPRPQSRLVLMRQAIVDVRSIHKRKQLLGHQTDIWKTAQIGAATFQHTGDGPDWMSWSGEIRIDAGINLTGFKASGLTVRDYIVLAVTPEDVGKSPFRDLRQAIPVRLTTDRWTEEAGDNMFVPTEYSDQQEDYHDPTTDSQPENAERADSTLF